MIEVRDLVFAYRGSPKPVLQGLNLTIKKGEYLALIGPNGCGKTTLLKHLNALLLPSRGEVTVNGLNTRDKRHQPEIRRRVGMSFQNPENQIVGMNIAEDVAFGPGNLGLPASEIRERVEQALFTVGLAGLGSRLPHTLSGGQKQLLALAGILAMNPDFIVLDEPTSALDPTAADNVISMLESLNRQGLGIILATQNMSEAAQADRLLVMHEGSLLADDKPVQILCRVDWLHSLHLAPPPIIDFMWRLQKRGLPVKTDLLSSEEAVEEIFSLLNRLTRWNNLEP